MPVINPHKFKLRRKNKGSQPKVSKEILGAGWSQSRISNVENPNMPERHYVTDEDLEYLADKLECKTTDLITNKDDISEFPADVKLFRKSEKAISYAIHKLNLILTDDQRLEAILNLYHLNTADVNSAVLLLRGFSLK